LKTLKQIADELGVKKQAVYYRVNRLPLVELLSAHKMSVDGVLTVDEEGERLIKQSFNTVNDELSGEFTTINNRLNGALSAEELNDNIINMLQKSIEMLHKQLEIKDKQLEAKDNQISALMELVRNGQFLPVADKKDVKENGKEEESEGREARGIGLWKRIFKRGVGKTNS